MTAVAAQAAEESADLAAFRAEARAWLEANATRRTRDVNEFKRRMTATNQTQEGELAHVKECKAWQRKLFDAGYAGIEVATEYGGQGRTLAEALAFRQEMAKYEIDTGVFSVGLGDGRADAPGARHRGAEAALRAGAAARRQRLVPAVLSEPGAGSDLAGLTTRAVRDGDDWIVDGQKVWNSFAHIADWGILLARTDWDVPKHRGITYFLVDMTTPGVEARPLRQITGVAHFNETFLTDVHIPNENVLGEVNGGWGVTQTTLMAERMLIGGGGMGLGWRDYLALAQQFGADADPVLRQRLAAMYTRFEILKWLGERSRAAMKAGNPMGPESSVMKLMISEHVALNGDLALAIEGADGMLYSQDAFEDGFWQQMFLGQWGIRIGGGTEQVQRNILGERVLGLPPEARPDKTEPFREVPKNT